MIYFIQRGENGPIKVGFTNVDPYRRRDSLQIGCPDDLHLLGVADGDEGAERDLHTKLLAHHIRGEWFAPHAQVLSCIVSPPPDRERAKLGDNAHALTRWRFQNNCTLAQLGRSVGCGVPNLSLIESGRHQPSLDLFAIQCLLLLGITNVEHSTAYFLALGGFGFGGCFGMWVADRLPNRTVD